jgi:hypothetical protein
VVANEVKQLASQTAKATEEIALKIRGVQDNTGVAVGGIREINGIIQQINSVSTSIAGAVEEQSAATGEIARNVNEAAKGTEEVSRSIVSVSQAATETAGGAALTRLPWRRRERQPDGRRGRGPSAFFQETPWSSRRPGIGHAASPDARSREPSNLTTAAGTRWPSRAPTLCKIAHQVFVKAGPGALPAGIISGG